MSPTYFPVKIKIVSPESGNDKMFGVYQQTGNELVDVQYASNFKLLGPAFLGRIGKGESNDFALDFDPPIDVLVHPKVTYYLKKLSKRKQKTFVKSLKR